MADLLIIDDEKSLCEEFCLALKEAGHHTDYATDGREGLLKVKRRDYTLIFLDASMPRMHGVEVFDKIRRLKKTPVAFLSGFLSPETKHQVKEMGALTCLSKPVDLNDIMYLVHSLE